MFYLCVVVFNSDTEELIYLLSKLSKSLNVYVKNSPLTTIQKNTGNN